MFLLHLVWMQDNVQCMFWAFYLYFIAHFLTKVSKSEIATPQENQHLEAMPES